MMIKVVKMNEEPPLNDIDSDTFQTLKLLLRLFWIYITCENQKLRHIKNAKDVIEKGYDQYFKSFYHLCGTFESCFGSPFIKHDDESDDDEPQSATRRRQVK